jgi:uncharacterized integral membrane protein
MKQSSHQGHGSDHSSVHESHLPYWKRMHCDWRIWVGVFLMLVAIIIYVMSEDFAWLPRGQLQQPLSGAVGK